MARHRSHRKNDDELARDDTANYRSNVAIIWARCPLCGRSYEVEMFWTGRGVPRRFCRSCRETEAFLFGSECDHEHNLGRR